MQIDFVLFVYFISAFFTTGSNVRGVDVRACIPNKEASGNCLSDTDCSHILGHINRPSLQDFPLLFDGSAVFPADCADFIHTLTNGPRPLNEEIREAYMSFDQIIVNRKS